MALNFKIYKSNANNGTKDKFYARASHKDTVSIKELAAVMQNNCTVKPPTSWPCSLSSQR